MRSTFRISTRLALTSVLSLALCTSMGLARTQAQGNSKDKMKSSKMMDHNDRMSGMEDDEYGEQGIPVAPAYPWAAPGALDLNHWTDYSAKHMRSGSATDAMMDKRSGKMGGTAGRMDHMEDEDELIPVAPSYPWAPPGALDMNHWSDYREMHMRSGSASGMKMDKMAMKDRDKMSSMMHEEDEEDLLPVAPAYPMAAPGSLDLNYWTDLTKKHMRSGSASDAKMENREKKHDKARMK